MLDKHLSETNYKEFITKNIVRISDIRNLNIIITLFNYCPFLLHDKCTMKLKSFARAIFEYHIAERMIVHRKIPERDKVSNCDTVMRLGHNDIANRKVANQSATSPGSA